MTLKCIIVDDEPLAAELLKTYVEKTPFLHLTGVYNSALTAMKDIRKGGVNLVFLDIQMPELSGIEFAKILPEETKIIFTTAFSQYAIEGFKVSALDYLLKPIAYEDFFNAASKALELFIKNEKADSKGKFVFVKSDYQLQRIQFDDILYVEGQKDYVRFYLENGQKIMSLINMKSLEDYLPKPDFLRIHRSYIVNMNKASSIVRMRVVINNQYLPISDSYKEEVQKFFDEHTIE